ncbi:MAG: DNA polymerase I [Nitrospirales bacterium]|nr:DNA polymerase I [Nitrospirales bacterium]
MEQYSLFNENKKEESGQEARDDLAVFLPGSRPVPAADYTLRELAFDVEATGVDPLSDRVVGIALCREKGRACYVPLRHLSGPNLPDALPLLKGALENASVAKIGHNLKYDILILRKEGIRAQGALYDTMLASYLLNPNKPGHSLGDVSLEYLSHRKRAYTEVAGKEKSFAEVPPEEATRYAAEDAELAMELRDILFPLLRERGLEKLYFDIEMPLLSVLIDMEEVGIRIDTGKLEKLSRELERELGGIEARIYALAGETFNINSPRQLGKVLFENLGLKPGKKTKTGYSTGMDVLEELAKAHELPGEVLNYRTLHKLKTTYADALPKLLNRKTGRIHTSFNQTVTATGRLSSSEPNLQNIPVRGEWGIRIREAFIADEGHVLISADYSQIELRILAHMSGDRGLIDAFSRNSDIHARTASELFGVPIEEVDAGMRRIAKVVNFGVVYGMSPYGLSEALGIPPPEASAYIERYFSQHPGVRDYIDATIQAARRTGCVSTLLGRTRPLPEIGNSNANVRQQAERLAVNSPIQGTAADLIKIAMIRIAKRLREGGFSTRMVLQIHDELLFDAPGHEREGVTAMIRHEMEHSLALSVPLKVEIGWGGNWAEAH